MADTPRQEPAGHLLCAGSYREMGFTQGQKLKEKIGQTMAVCLEDETFRLGRPWWLPTWLMVWMGKRRAARMLSKPLRRDFPEMHDRLEGLAEGAGLDLRLAYFCNAFESILASVSDRAAVPLPACSAVAARGKRSVTGEPIIVRNFDYVPVLRPFLIVREDRPRDRYRSLQFTAATTCSAFDGLNEHGLCITYNYGHTVDDSAPTGTISMLITEALERCKTVEQAARLISSRPRWGGAILMLADAQGDIASLELSSTRAALRRPKAGEDLILHTNKFHSTAMQQVQVPEQSIFTPTAHESLRGHRVLESAELRYDRLAELLDNSCPLTVEQLVAVMSDHGKDKAPSQTTPCVHGPYAATIASLHFLPRQRKMRVDFNYTCQAKFQELTL